MNAPQKYTVEECARRQDELWMITFLKAPGFAVSDVPIERGKTITVVNGRVV